METRGLFARPELQTGAKSQSAQAYNGRVTIEEQGEQEKAQAEALIAATPGFEGVETVSVELGDDHTGDPSMWVVFHLRAGLDVDEPWIRQFNDYSTKLGLKLIHSGLSRFPYTRLEQTA